MKTELPQDSPVCFHDFSVADESIAWSSCSSAGLASSSIHGAKLTLSLESTSFRAPYVALRFGIYKLFLRIFASYVFPLRNLCLTAFGSPFNRLHRILYRILLIALQWNGINQGE